MPGVVIPSGDNFEPERGMTLLAASTILQNAKLTGINKTGEHSLLRSPVCVPRLVLRYLFLFLTFLRHDGAGDKQT